MFHLDTFVRNGTARQNKRRVIIVGAGEAGAMMIRELRSKSKLGMVPVGIVDDNRKKIGTRLLGVPVLGTLDCIPLIASANNASAVIIAMPSAHRSGVRQIVDICTGAGLKVKTVPG